VHTRILTNNDTTWIVVAATTQVPQRADSKSRHRVEKSATASHCGHDTQPAMTLRQVSKENVAHKPARDCPCDGSLLEGQDSGAIKRRSAGHASYFAAPDDVRFAAHCGLKSDIAPCPKSADCVEKLKI
jgi:hypothetical protein